MRAAFKPPRYVFQTCGTHSNIRTRIHLWTFAIMHIGMYMFFFVGIHVNAHRVSTVLPHKQHQAMCPRPGIHHDSPTPQIHNETRMGHHPDMSIAMFVNDGYLATIPKTIMLVKPTILRDQFETSPTHNRVIKSLERSHPLHQAEAGASETESPAVRKKVRGAKARPVGPDPFGNAPEPQEPPKSMALRKGEAKEGKDSARLGSGRRERR